MNKNRLEAISDGVIAIILTIMVLELKVPHDPNLNTYVKAYPIFVSYALSYVFVGLYWSSHHHLFEKANKINNKILWMNMAGLFWLSFIPFTTATMGENSFSSITVTIYAVVLLLCVGSFFVLLRQLLSIHGYQSEFSKAFRNQTKVVATMVIDGTAALISAVGFPKIAFLILAVTALLWFVPSQRFGSNPKPKS